MANAFLVKPLDIVGAQAFSTVTKGSAINVANDYAGVTVGLACDASPNAAALRVDLGADFAFDTIMVFGVTTLPASGTYAVLYSTAAVPGSFSVIATGPAYAGATARTDGKGVTLVQLSAPIAGRFIQINYYAPAAGQSVELARVVVGRRFQPAIGFEYGAQFGVRDLGALDVSRRGVLLRNRGKKLRTVSLNFPAMTRQEAEGTAQKVMEQVGNTECIGLCTDPAADAELQNRCYFGPLVGDLGRTWATARGHEVRVNLLGLL
ncbi:hypothetical protein [Sphingomonas elodea]|uniref:hypothetical protein n=1 Tax=Sphingomonas elodea TaxID=179878 RepID=UPI0002631E2C|nr:hypothetical protein [Sphingomonas elodea]